MKLRRFDTSKIKVRSSGSGGGSCIPGGRDGGIGIGTLIIVEIAYFVFGADPMQTLSTVQGAQEGAPAQTRQTSLNEGQVCLRGPYATEACNALQSLNETWEPEFRRAGVQFQQPTLDLFRGGRVGTQGCGSASDTSAAVAGLLSHNTSITACSASLMRSGFVLLPCPICILQSTLD